MKKDELMKLVGKKVKINYVNDREDTGILRFTKEFSEKYEYSLPNYFLLNNTNFKASHVKKLEVLEE